MAVALQIVVKATKENKVQYQRSQRKKVKKVVAKMKKQYNI
jgi:hypothetical protein